MIDGASLKACPCCGSDDTDSDTIAGGVGLPEDMVLSVCMGCGFQIIAPNWAALNIVWNGAPSTHRAHEPYTTAHGH